MASNHGKNLFIPWVGGCYSYSNMTKYFNVIKNYKFDDKTIFMKAVTSIVLAEGYYQNSQHA